MARRSKVASTAFTGAAAAMTVGIVAAQAQAASSWHIKNNTTGYHGAVKLRNSGTITLKDGTTGSTLTCTTADMTGSVPASKVPAGTSPTVMQLATWSSTNCTIGGTIPFKNKLNKAVNFHAQTYSPSLGITRGYIGTKGAASAISVVRTGVGNACHAVMIGSTLPVSFKNPSRNLIVDRAHDFTMTVKTATSCLALHAGNKVYFSGNFLLSTPSKLTMSKS